MESPTTSSSSSSSEHSNWTRGRSIGRGSYATVHIATNNSTGHTFAVKSVHLSNSNFNQLTALDNEIQILQKLQNSSPHIIQYLGHDTTTSKAGTFRNLHLEYLPNGAVSGHCETEHVVRSYTRCLVAALAHLHSRNIVHCDVKGRNVLLGQKVGECKLADFGSAVEIRGNRAAGVPPRGSPLWMAPEVLRGEYQGPESDVWSLGCTVIEMLTGKVDSGGGDTVWQIAFADRTPEIPAGVSEQGRDFLSRCLRREAKERWSCEELMKHPFVASIGIESSLWSSRTPRCVLDEFESKFDEFEEMGSDSDSILRSLNTSSAIEELCCGGGGGGPVWEGDDGWMTVRRVTECSDSVTERGGNQKMEEMEGSNCDLIFVVPSCWAEGVGLVDGSVGASVCGYELKDVFGGVLCTLTFVMLLITSLFDNYWKILEILFMDGSL